MRETDPRFYILNGKEIIGTNDVEEWGKMIDGKNKIIAQDEIGDKWISTVFLGLDHNFGQGGAPILFETMVFDIKNGKRNYHDLHQERCRTYDEAEAMHKRVVEMVKNGEIKNDREENGKGDTD